MVKTLVLCGALATAACGATTRDQAPVTTPTSTVGSTTTSTIQTGPVEVSGGTIGRIPVGTEFDVRLQAALSSETATVEQRFEATTATDITQNGRVLVPAGSTVRGVVSDVKRPGRVDRVGSLTLSFDEVVVRGRSYAMRGMATQIYESGGIREEAGTAGAGAGVGAVVGGLLGGVKGAVLGAVIGAGGAIAATEGKDIHLPAGSMIRIRVDQPIDVR
jgi:hypothetical protein